MESLKIDSRVSNVEFDLIDPYLKGAVVCFIKVSSCLSNLELSPKATPQPHKSLIYIVRVRSSIEATQNFLLIFNQAVSQMITHFHCDIVTE